MLVCVIKEKMKALINTFAVAALVSITACSSPGNGNPAVSDTTSMRENDSSYTDTTAQSGVNLDQTGHRNETGTSSEVMPGEESNLKQNSRVSVGADTTGRQSADQP